MAPSDMTRVHERIDNLTGEFHAAVAQLAVNREDILSKIDEVVSAVRENGAMCGLCRPIVMGNGNPSLAVRLTKLEEFRRISARIFWLVTGTISTITAYGIWYAIERSL